MVCNVRPKKLPSGKIINGKKSNNSRFGISAQDSILAYPWFRNRSVALPQFLGPEASSFFPFRGDYADDLQLTRHLPVEANTDSGREGVIILRVFDSWDIEQLLYYSLGQAFSWAIPSFSQDARRSSRDTKHITSWAHSRTSTCLSLIRLLRASS
jgi:hypothetical protein